MRRFKEGLAVLVVAGVVAAALGPSGGASTGRATTVTDHRGGTLKLLAKAAGGTLDPQVNYTLPVLAALPGDLRRPARASRRPAATRRSHVVPDLAPSCRRRRTAARRWVFKLRKGIKFSNGKTVTPNDVVASFRRIFKVKSPTVGGVLRRHRRRRQAASQTPATCTLEGRRDRERQGGAR